MSDKIVFFGSGPVAYDSLRFILQHFEVEAIITKPATSAEMESLAPGIPIFTAQNATELDNIIANEKFSSKLGILVDFGVIVSRKVMDAFPLGIVNSHFSLLPKLRGADPITFAVLEGHEKTGVSLMLIDEKMDTGKLLTQKTLHIKPDATTPSLTSELIELSNSLLAEYVPKYISGEVKPRNQPHPDRMTYTRKLTKQDGVIDWNKPAEDIGREIRAFLGWPGSRTALAGRDVIITQARTTSAAAGNTKPGDVTIVPQTQELGVTTSSGTVWVERLKPAGKNEMSVSEFIRGYVR